jgi:hypothetical protein
MAKIMSLLLAITLWFLIKKNVETNLRPDLSRPAATPVPVQKPEPAAKPSPTEKPARSPARSESPSAGSKEKNDGRRSSKNR